MCKYAGVLVQTMFMSPADLLLQMYHQITNTTDTQDYHGAAFILFRCGSILRPCYVHQSVSDPNSRYFYGCLNTSMDIGDQFLFMH